MSRPLFVFIMIFITAIANAQSIDRSVIGNAGGIFTNTDVTVSYTIGETIIGLVADNASIDQGFWAGKGILVIPLNVGESPTAVVVYPNPVVEELTVFTGESKVLGMQLFAVNAQRVLNQKVDASLLEHKIDMSYMTRGVYILQLFLEGASELKEYKIIKN